MKSKYYKVNLENPIKSKKDDIFGYSYEIKRIKNAIDNNANLIGIISDYGAGKSSLIGLLKNKLCWIKYKVISINLWDKKMNQLEIDNDTNNGLNRIESSNLTSDESNSSNISITNRIEDSNLPKSKNEKIPSNNSIIKFHKNFLRQISMQVKKYNPDYVNRRINANYGSAKISFPSFRSLLSWLLIYIIVFGLLTWCIAYFGYDIKNISSITPDIKKSYVSFLISKFPLIISGFLISYIIFNKEVLFSFWKNSIKREITEEDTIQLYNELFQRNIKILSWLPRFRKNVIVIEDLDRIDDKNIVNFYLNEFYRLYVEGNKNNKDGITLVFCLKDYKDQETIELHDKVFDYITHIPQINYDDRESVLELLIKKDSLMKQILKYGTKDYSISNILWIIEGDNVTVRTIKRRIEYFKDIYLMILNSDSKSLKEKITDIYKCYKETELNLNIFKRINKAYSDYKVDTYISVNTCAFASYAMSNYRIELNDILSTYNSEHMNFIDYCIKEKTLDHDLVYKNLNDSFNKGISQKLEVSTNIEMFKKELINLIKKDKFDLEYKKYFYNFPIGTKVYNVNEKYVSDVILKDTEITYDNLQSINDSFKSVDFTFVEEKINKIIDLGKCLPMVCLYENKSLRAAIKKAKDELDEYIKTYFYINIAETDELCYKIKKYENSNISSFDICNMISNPIYEFLSEHDLDDCIKIRKTIYDIFKVDTKLFTGLFDSFPIDNDDLNNINDINIFLSVCSILDHSDEVDNLLVNRFNSFGKSSFEELYSFIKCLNNCKAKYKIEINHELTVEQKEQIYAEVIKDNINVDSKIFWLLKLNYTNESYLESFIEDTNTTPDILVKYMNKFDSISDKSIDYLKNANKLFDLDEHLINNLPSYSEIYLAYKIYNDKKLPNYYMEEHISNIFLKYSELTKYLTSEHIVRILTKKRIYRSLTSGNITEEKVLVFSSISQSRDILSSILENEEISLEIKCKYLKNIKALKTASVMYLVSLINKDTNIDMLKAIYDNRHNILNGYSVPYKREIAKELKRIISN